MNSGRKKQDYHGHKTMADGSHVPLAQDEATAILTAIEAAHERRAQDMPTARDALAMLIRAEARLNDLGWRKGGGLRVKRGEECAVAETGSTGMWTGRLDANGEYVHHGDYVSAPYKMWLKPLADLTEDERAYIAECDRIDAEAYEQMLPRYAAMGDVHD